MMRIWHTIRWIPAVLGLLLATVAARGLSAQEWGNLKGQFIYDGEAPQPAKLSITKDREECCQHDLVDESLVVDPQDHGLRNVIVFLYPARAEGADTCELRGGCEIRSQAGQ